MCQQPDEEIVNLPQICLNSQLFSNFLIVGQSGLIGPDGTEHGAWHRTDLHWIALIFKF